MWLAKDYDIWKTEFLKHGFNKDLLRSCIGERENGI